MPSSIFAIAKLRHCTHAPYNTNTTTALYYLHVHKTYLLWDMYQALLTNMATFVFTGAPSDTMQKVA